MTGLPRTLPYLLLLIYFKQAVKFDPIFLINAKDIKGLNEWHKEKVKIDLIKTKNSSSYHHINVELSSSSTSRQP